MTQVALVTGAGGALGAQVARTLAAAGRKLVLVDSERGKSRLDELASALGGAVVVTGDIAEEATWAAAMPRIERELGAPPAYAALVAGTWRGGQKLHEFDARAEDEVWQTVMRANLETARRSIRALLPSMVAARRGSIVVIGSRAAVQPWTSAGSAAYAASKAAAVALAQAVAAEVLDSGVRVNAVLPSTMDTPANRAAMPEADASRWVSLESVAGVVAFLLSDASRDVSGAALPVYGRS
ncbi:MAG TPA: SDR family NAD(P)-dependent oxidoreductase [Polyangiaceae bacterium]|jgi:NAD(P)-dependent dehydrogenase (short-subunit alcohol dehydrogenase family)